MSHCRSLIVLVALMALVGGATAAARPVRHPACALAVAHVNVIPMNAERVLADYTMVVADGKIALLALSAQVDTSHCSRIIDGAGRYLVPGLNDMHVHVESTALAQTFGVKAAPIDFPAEMALYMANGVTGLRVMSGAPDILAFRDSQHGQLSPYPRLLVATPMLSGDPPVLPEPMTKVLRTPQAAREAIRNYKNQGYDFVKIRENLALPVFRAVIDEARKVGFIVDGHITETKGIDVFGVLRSGQKGIAHLDNLALLIKDKAHDPDTYIRLLRACGCFVETTMQVERNALAQLTDYNGLSQRPELRYMHPLMLNAFWRKPNNPYLKDATDPKFFAGLYADEKVLLKKLYEGGAHIVAGTDALNPMIIPGASLHDELDSLVEAGLTPYQALQTATANPARYVPGFSDLGTLAPGRTANAVLIDGNPLADVRALRSPAAVMINGNWMTRQDLQDRLDAAAASFAKL